MCVCGCGWVWVGGGLDLKGNSHDFQIRVRYKFLAHKALSKRFYIFTWLLYCRSSAKRKGHVDVGEVDDATGS